MATLPEIFSKRGKPETVDVFQYTVLPDRLRIQVGHILRNHILALRPVHELGSVDVRDSSALRAPILAARAICDTWQKWNFGQFSRRWRKTRFSQVYQFVPNPLSQQNLVRILEMVREMLLEEYGMVRLSRRSDTTDLPLINDKRYRHLNAVSDCEKFFRFEKNVNCWLDFLELILHHLEREMFGEDENLVPIEDFLNTKSKEDKTKRERFSEAISRLNDRFRQAGFGFQYESGQIIRMDHSFTHTEITVLSLRLLADKRFANASNEFHQAHKHYRAGNCRETVINASNAVESVLKIICKLNQWGDHDRKNLGDLIKTVIRQHSLIPNYCQCGLQALSAIRNQDAAHGQGATSSSLTEPIAGYALHLAATNIVLLVNAFRGSDSGMQSPRSN